MEESKEQLQAEIHETREELGETLEALAQKVSPQQVAGQAREKVRDKLDDVADKVSPPRVARRQLEKVKDKLGKDRDEGAAGKVDDDTRQRIAEAARQIDARPGEEPGA